jgi:hypothetical protein
MNIKEKMEEIKSNKNILAGLAGLIIIIILIVVLSGGKEARERDEALVDENGDPIETEVEEVEMIAISPSQVIVAGDFEYAFSGIEWMFDKEDEQVVGTNNTYLKMMFADFTRNGNAITFGRPYKLGVHPGTCRATDELDTSSLSGIPVAYAKCSDGKITREFAVLQDSENVIVHMRETSLAGSDWQEWFRVNVTEVVR